MIKQALDYLNQNHERIKGWRHELHRHPELAFQEDWTANFLETKLREFGFEPVCGIGKTGLVATIECGDGPALGLRADMDALPIQEETGLPYASEISGCMHACGHDGHMAMLLAAAEYLITRDDLKGTIHFIFQPAEEGYAGAKRMIDDGLFKKFPVDEIYGLHNWPSLPEGMFSAKSGPQMAAVDTFEIKISGQGTHAAMPHLGNDVLTAASAVQTHLQTIVSRSINPQEAAVVSVTEFHCGDAINIMPSRAKLSGCTRHFSTEAQKLIERRIQEICDGIGKAFEVSVMLTYNHVYPATVNSDEQTVKALQAARLIDEDSVCETQYPSMASEDFSFMLKEKPGCFMWLGNGSSEGNRVLHSPSYDFNDANLATGAAYWISLVECQLSAAQVAH